MAPRIGHGEDVRGDAPEDRSRGVRFLEQPRLEAYGRVAVFADLYGNKWDLIEPASASPGRP